jgi:hypothetical protein
MIKVEVKENEVQQKENEYPCLKRSKYDKNYVVLFCGPEKGTVVFNPTGSDLGHYISGWNEENFEKFNGTITLSNG